MPNSARAPRPIHRMGPAALLVDCTGLEDVLALHALLHDEPRPDQAELIPAATTLLVRYARPLGQETARAEAGFLADAAGLAGTAASVAEVRIPVSYDGEDLRAVAELLDCSAEEIVRRHTEARWTAAFGGFSPGFAYLVQQDPAPENALTVPRRESPRTRVPAGSVALAGDFSAVYPSDSPGGWQLIGRTDAPVWDLAQDPPALVVPGAPVRFEAVRESVTTTSASGSGSEADSGTARNSSPGISADRSGSDAPASDSEDAATRPALRIDAPGLSTLVQDAGRPGHADWGVGPSGWADARAAHAANRVVGNLEDAPALENTAGGLRVTALEDLVLALTGARAEATVLDGAGKDATPVPQDRPFALRAGQTLALGPASSGLRCYLAVRGGLSGAAVLGSLASDTLSCLGPDPLSRGDELAVGPAPRRAVELHAEPVDLPDAEITTVRVARGPRTDWFTESSLGRLSETVWRVTEQSNRVGVRLEVAESAGSGAAAPSPEENGPPSPLERTAAAQGRELPSEGLAPGAVQVPPNGMPIVFLADHPVTGGYPVAGVVEPEHLRLLAQAAPGTRVRLALDTTDTLKES